MDATKREIRTIACELAVREAPQDAQGESRTIVGRAIVFNAESEMLDDWGYRFREVIKPEACTMEFLNSQDVKMNMLHDRSLTIARCNKGEGSMRLSVDDDLVAENGVLVRLENACDDVFAVCFKVSDERSDVSVAVDEEEPVDVRELSKTSCVDDLTEIEFAFSLLRKCGKCIVAVFLDELTIVFCSLCGITVEFASCNFADA